MTNKKKRPFLNAPDPGQKPGFFIAHPDNTSKTSRHKAALRAEIPVSVPPAHEQARILFVVF